MRQTFSQQFFVAIGKLHYIFLYQVAIDMKIENLVLEIWFVITQLKKYAELYKYIVRIQLAQYS